MAKEQAYGADISNFAGEIAPAMAKSFHDAGVRFCIVGYQYPDLFERQVRALSGAGIKVAAYFFIYWSRIGLQAPRLAAMLDHLHQIETTGVLFGWPRPDGTDMPKVWLDFEEDSTGTPQHLVPAETVRNGLALAAQVNASHLTCGVYTGEYWWKDHAANSTSFSALPLWHASQFTTTKPIPFGQYFAGHEYGGWTLPMCWQFRGTGDGGVSCDQNYEEWEATVVPPPFQPATIFINEVDGRQRVFVEQPGYGPVKP